MKRKRLVDGVSRIVAASPLKALVRLVEGGVDRIIRVIQHEGDVVGTIDFPRLPQLDSWSCGLRCVQSLCVHHGVDVTEEEIIDRIGTTEDGTAVTPIVRFLRDQGLRAGYHRRMSFRLLVRALGDGAVVLVDLDGTHWAIATATSAQHVWISDPSLRYFRRRITRLLFTSRWTGLGVIVSDGRKQGRHQPR